MSIDPNLFNSAGSLPGVVGALSDLDRRVSAMETARTYIGAGTISGGSSGQIVASSITASEISTGTIGASTALIGFLSAGTIETKNIVASAADIDKLHANTIAANTITAGQIAANTITAAQIAANTITAGQIAANTITSGQIQANTITSAEIAANTITAGQIQSGTITATEIAAHTITATQIAANTITATQIAAGTITATEIASGAVTSTKISVGNLAAISTDMGSITAGTITGSTIRTSAGTARVQMDTTGIFAKDLSNNDTFRIDAATGNVTLKGTLTTGSTVDAGAITTGVLATARVPAVGGGNFFLDSSFEKTGAPDWGTTGITKATTGGRLSGSAMLFTVSTTGTQGGIYQSLPVTAGRTYTLSSFIKPTQTRQNAMYLDFYSGPNGTGTLLASNNFRFTNTVGVWTRQSLTAVAPATAVSVRAYPAYVDSSAAFAGESYAVDDVQIEDGALLTGYAPRPDEILPNTILTTNLTAELLASVNTTFQSDFSGDPNRWVLRSSGALPTLQAVTDAQSGGFVFRSVAGSRAWIAWPVPMPYDPNVLYRVTARVRRVADATAGAGSNAGRCYAGVEGLANDGVTWINTSGSNTFSTQHYIAASSQTLTIAQGWQTFTGFFKGLGASPAGNAWDPGVPSVLRTGVKYFQPMFILGDSQVAGEQFEIDLFQVEVMEIPDNVITASKVAANSIVAGKIATDAVTANTIAAGAVTTSKMTANTIDGSVITANTLDAGKITAGTITSTQINATSIRTAILVADSVTSTTIAAGSITASELAIGQPLVVPLRNGNFAEANPADGTTLANGWTMLGTSPTVQTDATFGRTARFTAPSGASSAQQSFPLPAGRHILRVWCKTTSLTSNAYISATLPDLSVVASAVLTGTSAWTLLECALTIATAGTVTIALNVSGSSAGSAEFANVSLDSGISNVTINDGAITAPKIFANTITATQISATANITGTQLLANTITAGQIAAGTITANEIAAGAITASKISVGLLTSITVPNSNFAAGSPVPADGTTLANGWSNASDIAVVPTVQTDAAWGRTARIVNGSAGNTRAYQSVTLPVGRHVVRVWCKTTSVSGGSGAQITFASGSATATLTPSAGLTGTTGWTLLEAIADVTVSGTVELRLALGAATSSSGTAEFANLTVSTSVTGTSITPLSITTTNLATKSITADKINFITGGANLVTNAAFNNSTGAAAPENWVVSGDATASVIAYSATGGPLGNGTIVELRNGSSFGTFGDAGLTSTVGAPVLPSTKYMLSVYAKGGTARQVYCSVAWYDVSGTLISYDGQYLMGADSSAWQRFSQAFTSPSTAVTAKVEVGVSGLARLERTQWIANVQFEQGELVTPWGQFVAATVIDGTTITGGTVRTAASGDRIELSGSTLKVVSGGVDSVASIDPTSGFQIKAGSGVVNDFSIYDPARTGYRMNLSGGQGTNGFTAWLNVQASSFATQTLENFLLIQRDTVTNTNNKVTLRVQNAALNSSYSFTMQGDGNHQLDGFLTIFGKLTTGNFIYPGRQDTVTTQASWYLASDPSYGLWSNTGLRLGGTMVVTGANEAAALKGLATGASNLVYMSFQDSGGTRKGYVGDDSGADSNIVLRSDAGTASLSSGSDARIKTNVAPMAGSLAILRQLRPVSFRNTVTGEDGFGVIAQEVQPILPHVIHSSPVCEYLGVDYPQFIPFLLAGAKELDTEQARQKRRVDFIISAAADAIGGKKGEDFKQKMAEYDEYVRAIA